MGWHSAVILYACDVGGEVIAEPLRELSIRVFRVDAGESPTLRAEELGKDGEHTYKNSEGEEVSWRYIRVVEIQDLCEEELSDGAEVFSALWRGVDGDAAAQRKSDLSVRQLLGLADLDLDLPPPESPRS